MAYAALYLAAALVLDVKTDINPVIKFIVSAGAVGLAVIATWQSGYDFSPSWSGAPVVYGGEEWPASSAQFPVCAACGEATKGLLVKVNMYRHASVKTGIPASEDSPLALCRKRRSYEGTSRKSESSACTDMRR